LSEDQRWSEDEEEKKSNGCWPALIFLLFLSIVAYFILSFLGLVPHWKTIPSKLFPKAQKIEQAPSSKTTKEPAITNSPPINVAPPTPQPEIVAAPDAPDPFVEEVADTPGESLKRFLAAKTLEERRAYMTTTALSKSELRESLLTEKYPESHPPKIETNLAFPGSSDRYFTVTFKQALKGNINTLTIKVVTPPGTHGPKVDTSFFSSLIQAPIVDFNQNINPEPLSFQAIIEASAYCFDDIPNSDTMAKFMFFRNMDSKANPLATAYLPRNSGIFQSIKAHNAPGLRIPGTITVKWNQTLDPAKPFLEVIALKSSALK